MNIANSVCYIEICSSSEGDVSLVFTVLVFIARRLSENRLIYCGRDLLAIFSRKFRRIEQLFTSIYEKI